MLTQLKSKLRLVLLSWQLETIVALCCTVIYKLVMDPEILSGFAADPLGRILLMLAMVMFSILMLWLWWCLSSRFFRSLQTRLPPPIERNGKPRQ